MVHIGHTTTYIAAVHQRKLLQDATLMFSVTLGGIFDAFLVSEVQKNGLRKLYSYREVFELERQFCAAMSVLPTPPLRVYESEKLSEMAEIQKYSFLPPH